MKYLAMIAVIFAGTLLAGTAMAASDQTFVNKVQQDLLGQYALASVGQSHASSAAMKKLASEVAANAAAGNSWLKSYAPEHHLRLPDKPSIIADMQYGQLKGTSGHAFDKQLAQDLIVDTEVRMDTLKAEAATNSGLGRFAKKQLALMEKFSKEAHKLDH